MRILHISNNVFFYIAIFLKTLIGEILLDTVNLKLIGRKPKRNRT